MRKRASGGDGACGGDAKRRHVPVDDDDQDQDPVDDGRDKEREATAAAAAATLATQEGHAAEEGGGSQEWEEDVWSAVEAFLIFDRCGGGVGGDGGGGVDSCFSEDFVLDDAEWRKLDEAASEEWIKLVAGPQEMELLDQCVAEPLALAL